MTKSTQRQDLHSGITQLQQTSNRSITAEEIVSLLVSYQMMPQLLRELIIDRAIAAIECTPEEQANAYQRFYQENQLTSETEQQTWLTCRGISPKQLKSIAIRGAKIEKFQQLTWGHQLESYFLSRKQKLDQVIYSLIRVQDVGVAQELYFRIQEGEESFAELARTYSQGPEARTGGLIGPVRLDTRHPTLVRMLSMNQPSQLLPPIRVGDWLVIVRLEKYLSAQLNEPMRQQLLNECFESWLQAQLHKLGSINSLDSISTLMPCRTTQTA
jgi:parvulin-like peptidyl-prolyl isomerase